MRLFSVSAVGALLLWGASAQSGPCSYKLVESGVDVGTLCGTTDALVVQYNPGVNFSALAVGQPICCTAGTPPNFMPSQFSNGSCVYHTIATGESCETLYSLYYPITLDDLMNFNKETYNWYGCTTSHPWVGDRICVSTGTPPPPTPNPLAQCGPLAPGSKYNSTCPLNACCDQFGFCGVTSDFCDVLSSPTNAPGTTGCYSNCGMPDITAVQEPANLGSIAYFMGVDNSSSLLEMDPTTITADKIHYAFVNLNSDWTIDTTSLGQDFQNFVGISNSARVASFGGWDFSTFPATYNIFRTGVQAANAQNFANNLIGFLNQYNLDGIDIDWEYPGAQDIPGIPPDDPNNGENFLNFLITLKNSMPSGKTLSITLPASYWYLQGFPIDQMQTYVDYFILMTYDFYGQWDYGKQGIGCHVNETDSYAALQMVQKAGVSLSKVYGGIGNYARGYQLLDPACTTFGCNMTGPNSGAIPGPITQTPGFLTNVELAEIAGAASVVNQNYSDVTSGCDIIVFDNDQWFASMSPYTQIAWGTMFERYGLAGTSLWAANYVNAVPFNQSNVDWDEESAYLGDTIDYMDVYGCRASVNGDSVHDLSEVSNYDYMCRLEAMISYGIYIGANASDTAKGFLTNNIYPNNYKAYVGYISGMVGTAYFNFIEDDLTRSGGPQYVSCNDCMVERSGNDYTNGFAGGIAYPCDQMTVTNLNILPQNLNAAAAALSSSSYANMTINTTDFTTTNLNLLPTDTSGKWYCTQVTFDNSLVPSAALLLPDPLSGMTVDNATYIAYVVLDVLLSGIGTVNPVDLMDIMTPVLVFASIADSATTINDIGAQILAAEHAAQQSFDELILGIFFGILGVLTMFTGGWVGTALSLAVSSAQLFADIAITGSANPFDIVGVVVDSLGAVFDALKAGKSFNSAAAAIRNQKAASTTLDEGLYAFKYYQEVRNLLKPASCAV